MARPRRSKESIHAIKQAEHNFYRIKSSVGKEVLVRRGFEPPTITGGGSRWNTIERPRNVSSVNWAGSNPYTMDLPVLFDGWIEEYIVEADIAELNQMFVAKGPGNPPPTVTITGYLPVKGARWVITGIVWGSNVIWTKRGRLRQDATVNLLQYITEDRLNLTDPKSRAETKKLKKGQTVQKLAIEKYGSVKYVPTILKANGRRDAKTFKAGDTIRLPAISDADTRSR